MSNGGYIAVTIIIGIFALIALTMLSCNATMIALIQA